MINETPPFGAENLPVKEINETEKTLINEEKKVKSFKNWSLLILIFSFLLFLMVVIFLFLRKPQKKPEPLPSPSLLPSPSEISLPSVLPLQNLKEKINNLEEKLKTVELSKPEFSFPALDFNFNFKQ